MVAGEAFPAASRKATPLTVPADAVALAIVYASGMLLVLAMTNVRLSIAPIEKPSICGLQLVSFGLTTSELTAEMEIATSFDWVAYVWLSPSE